MSESNGKPARDDAPQVPGDFGVDTDPYTEDDGKGQSSPPLPEPGSDGS